MPSQLPSSFANAAAGMATDSTSRRAPSQGDAASFGDWARRPNGATQTFRRASTNHATLPHQRESSSSISAQPTSNPQTYLPPHMSAGRNGFTTDARYTRSQLLDLFREQKNLDDLDADLSDLFVGDFDPDAIYDQASSRWSTRDEGNPDAYGPDICIARNIEPTVLHEMTDDEKEHFTTTVNSPLKGPNQGNPTQRDGQTLRKLSISHGLGNPGLSSPASARPMRPRRETSESYPFPRDQASLGSMRKKPDSRDNHDEATDDNNMRNPLASLRRIATGPLSAGLTGPTSPWSHGPQSAGPVSTTGAFGSFALNSPLTQANTQGNRPSSGANQSRFRNLMSRDENEDLDLMMREKASMGSLGRLDENHGQERSGGHNGLPIGSAALLEAHEDDQEHVTHGSTFALSRLPTDHRQSSYRSSEPSQDYVDRRMRENYGSQVFTSETVGEPDSPTFTNPYRSPEARQSRMRDLDSEDSNLGGFHLPGLGGLADLAGSNAPDSFNTRTNPGYDHRQPSMPHASHHTGFPSLGGLGGFGALSAPGQWSSNHAPSMPTRESAVFNDNVRDNQSPSVAGFGRGDGFGSIGSIGPGTIGRGGKLGSLFPSGMQEQMRGEFGIPQRGHNTSMDFANESSQAFAGLGGSNFPPGTCMQHDHDPSSKAARGKFDDFFQSVERSSDFDGDSVEGATSIQAIGSQMAPNKLTSQLPAVQQKTMVMPDRIRWIYRDPQGNTQGPWSGLEMHEWYRAGFFSPELLVKKQEDHDYEPLAQLIRRIGNSREPFLVPQIGIPAPSTAQTPSAWPVQTAAAQQPPPTSAATASTAQPPFAGSFPSFGTTLTAEQQNALERRKQEEQYLMARQKEHLAQQQVLVKMQMQGQHSMHPQQLQHQGSSQSLHSQPSYGSLTSPGHPAQGMGAVGSGLEGLEHIKEEETPELFGRLGLGRADMDQFPIGQMLGGQHQYGKDQREVAAMARAQLQHEQAEEDALHRVTSEENRVGNERLQQFLDFHQEADGDQYASHLQNSQHEASQQFSRTAAEQQSRNKNLSLTEQVQQAASAKHSPKSPWAKIKPADVPNQPASPLPAPAAKRNRQHVADALAAESVSQSASPAAETPSSSIAPWAKETSDSQKQPSLKEIQQAESVRAAKHEAVASAMRRAAFERELAAETVAPAPGLPSSSNWASTEAMPQPAGTTASPWAKSTASKPPVVSNTSSKKTLQQIQKEEEAFARRQKAALAAASSNVNAANAVASAAQALSTGKRYADLAGKAASPAPTGPTAWTTVGAGGKLKAPPTPAAPTPALRSTSSGVLTPSSPAIAKPKAPTLTRAGSGMPGLSAMDDFKRWGIGELRQHLNKGMQVDDFITNLTNFPADTSLITEAVYQSSSPAIDSRRFAEEFVRRRALAEKGKAQPPAGTGIATSGILGGGETKTEGGGWSEVARKGPVAAPKEKEDVSFKVVSKKKGKR